MGSAYQGAAAKLATADFGGIFTTRDSVVAVGAAAIAAVQPDPNRIGLVLFNIGTTNLTLRPGAVVVSGQGILLLGNGANFSLNIRDDADIPAAGFYAISDLGGGLLYVLEFVQAFKQDKTGG